MNEQAHKAVMGFRDSVLEYMRMEYDPFWGDLYISDEFADELYKMTALYYFGGNTVCNAAGEIARAMGRM